ncbi:MAG: PAS domain S-box protein [Nitrospirae bacterium]|nr:PAS domain S-box protein [Nitrospirota bacterium]MBF0535400.1 PAS domain S-box protein [Nitrospirota bacterium]MBF0616920.1 PAS domain S-box protein [Nitrospirota bacterium]
MASGRIFVVDDEVIISQDITVTLKKLGYDVVGSASTGQDAIDKVLELKPDLILMDIQLIGDIDGIEAAREIHNYYDIPVIFVSSYSDDQLLKRAKVTGPFGYILKPFDDRSLYASIEMTLFKHGMEKKLKENSERYAMASSAGGIGIWDWDIESGDVFIDTNLKRMAGYNEDEIENSMSAFYSLISVDDTIYFKTELQKAISQCMSNFEITHKLKHKDGTVLSMLARGKVYCGKRGKPTRVMCADMDISRLTAIEKTLKKTVIKEIKQKEFFKAMFEKNIAGIIITEINGRITNSNKTFQKMLGYKAGDIAGRFVYDLTHPEDIETAKNFFNEILVGNRNHFTMEARYLRKTGGYCWGQITVSLIYGVESSPANLLYIVEDIQRKKDLEEQFQKKTKEINLILDSIPACIWVLDSAGLIVNANRYAVESSGSTLDELKSTPFSEVFTDIESSEIFDLIESGKPQTNLTLGRMMPSGETKHFRMDAIPYTDSGNGISGVVVYAYPVTETTQNVADDTTIT